MKMTKEQFQEIGRERYGEDPNKWVFVCGICGFKQSRDMIINNLKKGGHQSKRYGLLTIENINKLKPSIEQECLSPDCNYVSYGLIPSTFCNEDEGVQIEESFYLALAKVGKKR